MTKDFYVSYTNKLKRLVMVIHFRLFFMGDYILDEFLRSIFQLTFVGVLVNQCSVKSM